MCLFQSCRYICFSSSSLCGFSLAYAVLNKSNTRKMCAEKYLALDKREKQTILLSDLYGFNVVPSLLLRAAFFFLDAK